MDYNNYSNERHKQLLKRSQNLQKQGRDLFTENSEEYFELLKYNIAVEDQVFWNHRKEFFLLMKIFLANILDFEGFEDAFSLLFRKTTEEVKMSIIDLEQIKKFQLSPEAYPFASSMGSIFRQFEEVEDEYCTEQDVKDYVKEIYFKYQEE